MCGIAGVINGEVHSQDIWGMIQKIRYRGLDEAGVEDLGRAKIGHVRLAIVDKENGMQPMSNQDDTVWVVFNGEIYNFVELRESLQAKGYHFKSRCDTEVLVHLWQEKGEKMLDDLVGMYAFFIWDENQQKGMLARDRQGIKPCFVAPYKGGWAFCSEMKGILSLPDFPREINDETLKSVFAFNYPVPPQTCFKHISHLSPGSYLLFEGDAPPVEKRYWEWPFAKERQDLSFEDFEALLDEAIRLQMRFDVKGGLYLSGGVDSSCVASRLRRQWNEPQLQGVGLDFENPAFSEYGNAEYAASLLDVTLSRSLIQMKDITDIAEKVSYHAEQPHGDFSFFLFYTLAKQANAAGRVVMFSGDGPDEAMAGFSHNESYFMQQDRMNFSLRDYFNVICFMQEGDRQRLLDLDFEKNTADPRDTFESILSPWRDLEPIEQIMAYECTTLMPGNNLVKGDRMGACWSVEGRSPFLDHRVTEAMVRLPLTQKFKEGKGKYFLKNYTATKLPREFIFRKKTMPTTPIGEWVKGPLFDWAHGLLSSNKNPRFNTKAMVQLLEDHRAGKVNGTRQLRTLIMTQLWLKNYIESPISTAQHTDAALTV